MEQTVVFDRGFLAGLGTVLAMLAFVGICLWAYSGRNKARFKEAALLPFADEERSLESDGDGDSHLETPGKTETSQRDGK